jgi:hypothetical protein
MKVLAACLKFRLAVKWDTWTLNRHGLNKAARETAPGPPNETRIQSKTEPRILGLLMRQDLSLMLSWILL